VDSNGAEGVEAASESHLVAMVADKGKIKTTRLIHEANKEIKLHTCPHVHVKGYSRPLPVLEVPAGHLRRRGRGRHLWRRCACQWWPIQVK
jgi:hypothetical protein